MCNSCLNGDTEKWRSVLFDAAAHALMCQTLHPAFSLTTETVDAKQEKRKRTAWQCSFIYLFSMPISKVFCFCFRSVCILFFFFLELPCILQHGTDFWFSWTSSQDVIIAFCFLYLVSSIPIKSKGKYFLSSLWALTV